MSNIKCMQCKGSGWVKDDQSDTLIACKACTVIPKAAPPIQLHDHEDVALTRLGEKLTDLLRGPAANGIPYVSIIGLLYVKQQELHTALVMSNDIDEEEL